MLNRTKLFRTDNGSTLVTTVVVMLVLMAMALTAAAVVTNTTRSLDSSRYFVQARAAADAGLAQMVSDASREGLNCPKAYDEKGSAPSWTGAVECDTTKKTATFTSTGYSGASTIKTRAVYEYEAVTSGGSADGALVSGDGGMNASSVQVLRDGDLLLNSGSFDCNNSSFFGGLVGVLDGSAQITNYCKVVGNLYVDNGSLNCNSYGQVGGDVIVRNASTVQITNNCKIGGRLFIEKGNLTCDSSGSIAGDVVVRSGTAYLSNSCSIGGRLISLGAVTMDSSARVEGDVATLGNLTTNNSASVAGSVDAGGIVSLQGGGKFGGSVKAASTADSYLNNVEVGPTWIGGGLKDNLKVTVNGDLLVAGSRSVYIESATIRGNLQFGGGYRGSAPSVTGNTDLNKSGIGAPTVTLPTGPATPSSPTFNWADFPYDQSAWTKAGWNTSVTLTGSQCDLQNNATSRTTIRSLTVPSVIDTRSCTSVNAWGATLEVNTDIVLIVNKINAEQVKVRSADGAQHQFSIVIPDNTDDNNPTCAAGQGDMQLYAFNMDEKIHGIAYSPCTINVSNSSTTQWYGQIYGGKIANAIGGIKLYYEPITLPGLESTTGGGAGGTTTLVIGKKPIEQGDVG